MEKGSKSTKFGKATGLQFRCIRELYDTGCHNVTVAVAIFDAILTAKAPNTIDCYKRSGLPYGLANGRVAEWLMAPVLKTGVPETVSGVRIPSLPPLFPRTGGQNGAFW